MRVKILKVGQKTHLLGRQSDRCPKDGTGFHFGRGRKALYLFEQTYLLLPSIAWDRLKSDGRKWAGVEPRLVRDANMWLLGRLGCVSLLLYLTHSSQRLPAELSHHGCSIIVIRSRTSVSACCLEFLFLSLWLSGRRVLPSYSS